MMKFWLWVKMLNHYYRLMCNCHNNYEIKLLRENDGLYDKDDEIILIKFLPQCVDNENYLK